MYSGHAQTFDEWFEQNSTRKEYQEEQIGELQLYTSFLEKGYGIVESGLSSIGDIKTAEFNLHNSYYTSLRTISPAVSGMPEVEEILTLQEAMVSRFSSSLTQYNASIALRQDEVDYLNTVYVELMQEGSADMTLLSNLLTDNTLGLTDDQRMSRVLVLDKRARLRYEVTMALTDRADLLAAQRTKGAGDMGSVKALYGLP
jgi:hypothetical protein